MRKRILSRSSEEELDSIDHNLYFDRKQFAKFYQTYVKKQHIQKLKIRKKEKAVLRLNSKHNRQNDVFFKSKKIQMFSKYDSKLEENKGVCRKSTPSANGINKNQKKYKLNFLKKFSMRKKASLSLSNEKFSHFIDKRWPSNLMNHHKNLKSFFYIANEYLSQKNISVYEDTPFSNTLSPTLNLALNQDALQNIKMDTQKEDIFMNVDSSFECKINDFQSKQTKKRKCVKKEVNMSYDSNKNKIVPIPWNNISVWFREKCSNMNEKRVEMEKSDFHANVEKSPMRNKKNDQFLKKFPEKNNKKLKSFPNLENQGDFPNQQANTSLNQELNLVYMTPQNSISEKNQFKTPEKFPNNEIKKQRRKERFGSKSEINKSEVLSDQLFSSLDEKPNKLDSFKNKVKNRSIDRSPNKNQSRKVPLPRIQILEEKIKNNALIEMISPSLIIRPNETNFAKSNEIKNTKINFQTKILKDFNNNFENTKLNKEDHLFIRRNLAIKCKSRGRTANKIKMESLKIETLEDKMRFFLNNKASFLHLGLFSNLFMVQKIISENNDSVLLICQHKFDQMEYSVKVIFDVSEGLHEIQILGKIKKQQKDNFILEYRFSWKENEIIFVISDPIIGTLDSIYLQNAQKPSKKIFLKVLISISKALKFIHEQNIVHFDVNPINIVQSVDGEFFLANFGKSRVFYDYLLEEKSFSKNMEKKDEEVKEKSDYEKAGKNIRDLKKKDVYAFGLVLINLIFQSIEKKKSLEVISSDQILERKSISYLVEEDDELIDLLFLMTSNEVEKIPTANEILEKLSTKESIF